MFTNTILRTALASVIAAVFLLTPGDSEAQRGRRGGFRGGDRGRYYHDGFYGGSLWLPGYYGPGYYDNTYVAPQYDNQSNYFSPPVVDSNTAQVVVRLPDPNAEVWFDNSPTQQKGTVRTYESAMPDASTDYVYHVRAKWTDNGRAMDQTRDVHVRAGQQSTIDFAAPIPQSPQPTANPIVNGR